MESDHEEPYQISSSAQKRSLKEKDTGRANPLKTSDASLSRQHQDMSRRASNQQLNMSRSGSASRFNQSRVGEATMQEELKGILAKVFQFYTSFGERTNFKNLRSNKFHKMMLDCAIPLNKTDLDLLFVSVNKHK
jgi:hypothetical protein